METSFFAYPPDIGAPRFVSPFVDLRERSYLLTLCVPIFWLLRFLLRVTAGEPVSDHGLRPDEFEALVMSGPRRRRRSFKRGKAEQQLADFEHRRRVIRMMSRDLSPAQYVERTARLSLRGRVRIYGLRFLGSVLQRRAQLSCYDHGTWRAPRTASMTDGVWDAHLPLD